MEAIHNYSQPTTKKEVCTFLGLASYYQQFVPNFASIDSPLSVLTRKGEPKKVCQTPATEMAFQPIMAALKSSPVLRNLAFQHPFLLYTDTSETGLEAMLLQDFDGEEHPMIYISHQLTLIK